MTTEQPSAPSGASGRASGRHSLHLLVQQIGEIVAQGEDSGSQQQSQSDGGLRVRLRTVLLALLDGIMGDSAGERADRHPAAGAAAAAAAARNGGGAPASSVQSQGPACLPACMLAKPALQT